MNELCVTLEKWMSTYQIGVNWLKCNKNNLTKWVGVGFAKMQCWLDKVYIGERHEVSWVCCAFYKDRMLVKATSELCNESTTYHTRLLLLLEYDCECNEPTTIDLLDIC